MSLTPKFSIIIPAKDEAKRLPLFLTSVAKFCQHNPLAYEIIVVDDGSSDDTTAAAQSFQQHMVNLHILRLATNRGKGFAIKHGFTHATGEVVLFIDADGATPITEINRQAHWFDEGFDIVIGSREIHDASNTIETRAHRKFMGRIFNFLVQALLVKGIEDTQCGFKMFRRPVALDIMKDVQLTGFGVDLEILYLAQRAGYHIKETAVNWHHVPGSKVHLLRDSWRMLLNIFDIRKRHAASR